MKTPRRTPVAAALLMTVALTVTGCGGGANSSTTATSQTPPAAPSGLGPTQIKAIRHCLKAAGLDQSLPQGAPSGIPSNLPSGVPTDLPSSFSGGPRGSFDNPEVQAALKACGIRLPSPQGG